MSCSQLAASFLKAAYVRPKKKWRGREGGFISFLDLQPVLIRRERKPTK